MGRAVIMDIYSTSGGLIDGSQAEQTRGEKVVYISTWSLSAVYRA
jgi:hypothetical protein